MNAKVTRKIKVLKLPEPSGSALTTYYIIDPAHDRETNEWLLGAVALEDIGNLEGPSDWAWVVRDLRECAADPLVGEGYYVEYMRAIAVAVAHFSGIGAE